MKTKLHGNLYHHSTEHESGICGGTAGREGPSAKQAERLDNMIALRDVGQCTPNKARYRASERGQQVGVCWIPSSADTNNCPEE